MVGGGLGSGEIEISVGHDVSRLCDGMLVGLGFILYSMCIYISDLWLD